MLEKFVPKTKYKYKYKNVFEKVNLFNQIADTFGTPYVKRPIN
jgi:hypothetical protein